MAKRKQLGANPSSKEAKNSGSGGEESDSDTEMDMVNVDFEWFDPQPDHDFHGLKTLLRQLFDVDAQLFDLSALTDLILAQPLLGSTVKVDGNESDPYAFLTVLNLHEHRDQPVIRDLRNYLSEKALASPALSRLARLLSPDNSSSQIGLILTERLVNVPNEVVPPMYTMLLEEIQWALEEKEPYDFTDFVILSKTYTEVQSSLDEGEERPSKKSKNMKGKHGGSDTFYFHPEDEVLRKHAAEHAGFDYTRKDAEGAPDSKRAFLELGIRPQGLAMLIEAPRFKAAVEAVRQYLNPE